MKTMSLTLLGCSVARPEGGVGAGIRVEGFLRSGGRISYGLQHLRGKPKLQTLPVRILGQSNSGKQVVVCFFLFFWWRGETPLLDQS